ncbi:MAG: choice-of-anchor L domain-containing protein [Phaeodactylibacter sp.]|uniref:choice-of-anchor L domain-containing protein n=1 Tax=Phaeodactylibacter sp. TaxID=1940289 RepID=UPI0032ED02DB
MRKHILLAPLFLLLTFVTEANNDPIVVNLEQTRSRHRLSTQADGPFALTLCQLQPGEQYQLWLSPQAQQGGEVRFLTDGGTPEITYSFTASAPCQSIPVAQLNPGTSKTRFILSVSCESCERPADENRLAALTVSPGVDALTLIQDIFIGGNCFDVSNVSVIGNASSAGQFGMGDSSIGIGSGVIISSGNVTDATGPNNSGSTGNNMGGGSHPDLADLAGANAVFDASGIEFQFTPTVDNITFRYAFASEEYCEFVDAGYNDVFGFFISGPGINGGFTGNGENIAVLPGSGIGVTIDNINDQDNTVFFVPNSGSCGAGTINNDIEFDGFTKVLTAIANVQECETYTIRLLVGDVGDGIYDSAVFLEANSFAAGGTATGEAFSPTTNSNITYEACSDGYFTLNVGGDLSTTRTVNLIVSPNSTATPGVDYAGFPLSVTAFPGQSEIQIPIDVFQDNLVEGQESIILEIENSCSCINGTIELIIQDSPPLDVTVPPVEVCPGEPASLAATVSGGLPGFSYAWSNGSPGSNITVTPNETTTYTVTVTDQCGLTSTTDATVTVSGASEALLSGQAQFCEAPFTAQLQVTFQGAGPWLFAYSLNGVPQPEIVATENPLILEVDAPGFYQAEYVAPQAYPTCVGQVQGTAFIELLDLNPQADAEPVSCTGATDGEIAINVSGGVPPFYFSWYDVSNDQALPDESNNLTGLAPGLYEAYIVDGYGCADTVQVEVEEPELVTGSIASTEGVNCLNPNGGSIDLQVSGGSPGYDFSWSNGDSNEDPANLPAGEYFVTITDDAGCTATASAIVEENFDLPTVQSDTPDTVTCFQPAVTLDGTGSSTGTEFTATWSGPGLPPTDGLTAFAQQSGDYILTISNTVNGCVAYDTVTVAADNAPPVIALAPATLTCDVPEIQIYTDGSSTGTAFEYAWSGPAITSGANTLAPTVNAPGNYTLSVTNTENGCTNSSSVTIGQNTTPPAIDAGASAELTCEEPETTLGASANGNTNNFIYSWSSPDGNILSGADALNPTVNAGGLYQLEVTDTINGCTSIDTVSIIKDDNLPVAIINGPQVLDCNNTTLQFDAQNSNLGPDGIYEWSTADGNIVSGSSTLTPVIDGPGEYQLVISAPSIACYDTAALIITIDTITPQVDLPVPGILNCYNDSLLLQGTASTNSGQNNLTWSGPAGTLPQGISPLEQSIVQPGLYSLQVTDPVNGCTTTAQVNVQQDITPPQANIATPEVLDCGTSSVTLDGSASSAGNNFNYTWTVPDTSAIGTNNNQLPGIDQPGAYQLEVLNTDNGCSAATTILVEIDTLLPEVVIAPPATLTCTDTVIALAGSATANSNALAYEWTTPDGNLLSGATTPELSTDAPGTYSLQVTNTDNECVQSLSVTVDQDVETPSVDAGPATTLNCADTTYTLQANASGNAPLSYTWESGNGNIVAGQGELNAVIDAPGIYTLLVTNQGNGCTNSSSVNIDEDIALPGITVDADPQIDCDSPTATLDASNSDAGPNLLYQWTSPDGNFNEATDNPVITALQAGTYTLQITNTDNLCTVTEAITVVENTAIPQADAGADGILDCEVSAVSIGGSNTSQDGPLIYTWTLNGNPLPNAGNPTVDATQPGLYQLSVLNTDNQCEALDEVAVTIDTVAPTAAALAPDVLTCNVTSLQLDASASSQGNEFTYTWSTTDGQINGQTDVLSPTVSSGGTYTLVVTDNSNGCQSLTTVSVQQDTLAPIAEAGVPVRLTCTDTLLNLDATASSQGNFLYNWSGQDLNSGADGLTPAVQAPGTYELLVTNTQNGCTSTDQVQVTQDVTPPDATIEDPEVLNCTLTQQSLDAAGSSQGADFSYSWTTANGTISAGAGTLQPTINAPGTYNLLVVNTDNGCTSSQSIDVDQDITPPVVAATTPDTLTCTLTSLQLDATASSSGTIFQYTWSTPDGNLQSGSTSPTPSVNSGGNYLLTLTNTENNCVSTLEVQVVQDTITPVAEAGLAQELNCDFPSLTLSGNGSSIGGYTYNWNGPGLINGNNGLSPEVNQPGTYTLSVTNDFNGCLSTDAVQITQDTLTPTIAIADPQVLNCAVLEQQLQAGNSSQGTLFQYTWSTSNGNINSGSQTLQPTIDAPGEYTLLIENTGNGCDAVASIVVEQDIAAPVAAALTPDTLTCATTSVEIDASASSNGAVFDYNWATANGQILSGGQTNSPTVGSGGTYTLTLSNTVNFCSSELSIPVVQDTLAPVAEAGTGQELNCDSPSLTLSGAGSSTGDFTYAWQGPGVLSGTGTLNPDINLPGTYTLLVTNNFNQCTSTDAVEITQDVGLPSVIFAPPATLTCAVETATLDASASTQGDGFNFNWSTQDGQFVGETNSLSVSIDQPGTYLLTIENVLTGCTNTNQVVVDQDITPPAVDAGNSFVLECWENTATLDGSDSEQGANIVYQWITIGGNLTSGATTTAPVIDAPGLYTLMVTNTTNGCTDQDEVLVTQPIPEASFDLIQPPCYGDPGTIRFPQVTGGTPPYAFSIDGGETYQPDNLFADVSPGNYELIVQDENGCTFEANAAINQPDSTVTIIDPAEATIEFGESIDINAQTNLTPNQIAQVFWSNANTLSCADCLRPTANPLRTTDYLVTVVSQNGCIDQAPFRLFVDRTQIVYIPNAFSPNGDGTNDWFYIFARNGTVEKIRTFQIYNRWGEPVFEGYNLSPNNPEHGWDGMFRGELMNNAVFAWFAEIEFVDGTVEIFEGDVQLTR